jgi:membrane fusion protein (multidrug efflux system)
VRVVRLAAAGALLLACLTGCAAEEEGGGGASHPLHSVEVVTVTPQVLVDTASLTGQLEAESSVVVKPEMDGVVASIEFIEGEPVKEGQVLLTLRDDMQRARVAVARAELRLAEQVFERESKLQRRDASSQARIEETRATLATSRAQLELAQIELARTRIRAPFDGTPGIKLVAVGERVEDDASLVEIAAIDRLQLLFTVPETAVALARQGAEIAIRVAAFPGESFPGQVFFVSPTIDPATRRLVLKAWIDNADHRLKPGMFANVDVQVSKRHGALLVPEAAMVYDRNGTYVWRVVEGDVVQKVPVEVGVRKDGEVEIRDGLSPGDRVVAAGTHKVMAGDRVEAVAPRAAAETPRSSPDEPTS